MHPNATFLEYQLNRLLAVTGVVWGKGYLLTAKARHRNWSDKPRRIPSLKPNPSV